MDASSPIVSRDYNQLIPSPWQSTCVLYGKPEVPFSIFLGTSEIKGNIRGSWRQFSARPGVLLVM